MSSQGHSKHKASASANAQQRAQNENHLSEAPPASHSNRAVDQDRAVPETALQGADRPATGRHGKVDRTDPRADQELTGRTPQSDAQSSVRRSTGQPDGHQQ